MNARKLPGAKDFPLHRRRSELFSSQVSQREVRFFGQLQ
jgi:hypothetical protein